MKNPRPFLKRCIKVGLVALALPAVGQEVRAAVPVGKPQQLTAPDQVPEGLAKSDWQSIRAAYEAGRHAFMPIEGGWQARNPGQQWTTKFDGRGFIAQPRGAEWQWGLELKSYGFAGQERAIGGAMRKPAVKAEGQRLTYAWDDTVQEWWVNDQRGLEHGFTVKQRPPGAPEAPLQFDLAVRGTLIPVITADSLGVEFRDASGATVLNYTGLKVWDADGKTLTSRFVAVDASVRLMVEERGARYPLTIDPIAQQAYLKADINGPASDDLFGCSVAVSGDTVVVGAYLEDSSTTGVNSTPDESATNAGAAYVFVRSGTTWTQQAYLKPTAVGTTQAGDIFGWSVAVSGDTVVVGAINEDSSTTGVNSTPNEGATNAGAAYVFVRSGTLWTQQAYLKPAAVGTTQAGDRFGTSVAVSGDTVVVGANWEDSSTTGVNSTPNELTTNAGAAYVFVRSGTTWTQQAYLKPAVVGTTQDSDWFGNSVAIDGNTVVIGAIGEASSTTDVNSTPNELAFAAGAAYVFVRSGTTWTQQAYLKPAAVGTTQAADRFGGSVAVSGDTVVVGAALEDSSTTGVNSTPDEGSDSAGAAFVFVRSGTTWTQQAYLKPTAVGTTQAGDEFGYSVAVSGNTVVVGAYPEDSSTTGINSTPDESASGAGAAYVFVRSGTTWTQEAYLKPAAVGTTQAGDIFGRSVAIDGDTLVVGAHGEDSSTTGVNSTPDESASGAGAAYVFVRSGTTWSQQAYLKASNTGASSAAADGFGNSVAIDGDTVVVGAQGEDSSTTGVNSTPDESAAGAGAVYVFVRSGTTWTQQAYLKPAAVGTTQAGDGFGFSVAVSGDTVVVGAGEDSSTTGVNSMPNELAFAAGAAYVFVRSGTTWSQEAYLKPAAIGTTQAEDAFGCSVAVSGDTVVVGAYYEDSSTTGVNSTPDESATNAGAAYVFTRTGTTWSQQAYLKPAAVGTTQAGDRFGTSVAVAGDTVVVGAELEDSSRTGVNSTPNEGAADAGAAYVFVRSGTTWSQQAYLKPGAVGTTQANDRFGNSVAVSGDTVVIGALLEDSSTTGVNSTPNEGAADAGAAFVFVRSGTTWSQKVYLKPGAVGTTQANDRFGSSVAVSGGTVVIGALLEDSSTTGVNSTPNDLAGGDVGAAYVFVRSGTTWIQRAYLKPGAVGTTQANDQFGSSVGVSGDTVIVGAIGEDSSTTGVNSTPDESASGAGAAYIFTGLGPAPEIAVEQPAGTNLPDGGARDFGGAAVGVFVEIVFTIKNTDIGNLTGLGITLDGSGASQFSISESPVAPVTQNGFTTFTVQFAPTSGGAKTATLHIANNDPDENPFDITLTGTGLSAEIAVAQPSSTNIADGGSKSFGDVAVGANAPLIFTIRNTGTANLTGLGITLGGLNSGEFIVTASPTAPVPGPNGGTTFTVLFTPVTTGPRYASLHIASNDTDENPFDITLTGTGVIPITSWRQTHFGSTANSGDGADLNDYDNDGLVNLIEYAFGLNPTLNSAGQLPQGQIVGANFVLSFTEPVGVTGVTYGAEWSATMAANDWHAITDTGTAPQHTFSVPISGNTFLSMRLRVTSP
jgi:hypothetical protein